MNDARELFLRLCGIDVADVAVPHRLLLLPADERNALAIEQAAAELLTLLRSSAGQIPSPQLDWMTQQVITARNFMLVQCEQPQSSIPSGPPPVVVRTALPRRRSGFDAENVLGIIGILVMLAAAGIGAKLFHDQWWKEVMPRPAPKPQPVIDHDPIPPRPAPIAKPGRGERAKTEPEPEPPPRPLMKHEGDFAAARVHVRAALANVRRGFFDEADLDAQKALMAAPECDEAQATRMAIAYIRQYSSLADKAMAALNENNVVDLGQKHGRAAFISRGDDGSITFQVKGRPKKFASDDLEKIPGFRFRVTRDFLDNAINPANDLILGSYHLVSKLDGDGDVDPKRAIDAARERWRKAAESGDEQIVEQAGLLLKLLTMEPSD